MFPFAMPGLPFLSQPTITVGSTGPRFLPWPVTFQLPELMTHWHVIGASGSGKSRFLAHLFLSLFRLGLPATLVDPHGDLARLVLAHLVSDGVFEQEGTFQRLVYLDLPQAERQGRFLRFNVLRQY